MRDEFHRRIKGLATALESAAVVVCCLYLLAYVAIALQRLAYPFDLEWMEGGSVDHVRRLMSGEKVYVAPSLAFIPYVYPPFYYAVSALVSLVTGIGLLPLRLVSFVSSIGCFLALYRLIRDETDNWRAGLVATGMFAATYRIGGAWLDLARVDSLFLWLILLALYQVRFGRSTRSWVVAGVLIALAALTKQTAIVMAPLIVLYSLIVDWRRALALSATTAAIFALATGILELTHRGWYLYYVFGLPARLQDVDPAFRPFWRTDVAATMPIALVVAAAYLISQFSERRRLLFYGMLCISFVGSAWASRLHGGAYTMS